MADARRSVLRWAMVVLIALVVVAGIGIYLWITTIRNPEKEHVELTEETSLRTVGFNESRKSTLAEGYVDADGDLIADAPKDASKLVDPPTLVFSYVAVEDVQPFKEAWKDFEDYLGKQTGKKIEYLEVTNPEDQLKAMHDGKLHVTGFNTGLVPAAVNQAGFVPVSTLGDEKGKGEYKVQIIVKPDSSIQDAAGLKDHELTLTEIGSNSGYKAPLVMLKKDYGLLPFKNYLVRYSGGHENSIRWIVDKECEAAAVASDVLERDLGTVIKQNQFRTIYTSPDVYPKAGLGYVYNLKPELTAKIRKALLEFPWKGTSLEKHFGPAGQTRFVPVNYKTDWQKVREIDDAVGHVLEIKDVTSATTRSSG